MCGRYRLTAKERYLRDHFGLDADISWSPRWNIAPTQQVPIIRQHKTQPRRTFDLVRWVMGALARSGWPTSGNMHHPDDPTQLACGRRTRSHARDPANGRLRSLVGSWYYQTFTCGRLPQAVRS